MITVVPISNQPFFEKFVVEMYIDRSFYILASTSFVQKQEECNSRLGWL